MLENLPDDIRKGLEGARHRAQRRGKRLCVHMGERVYPIMDLTDTGFSVDPARVPPLRGFVDIHDGPRHLSRALIIAADEGDDVVVYEFKRETLIPDTPIRDFVEERATPTGLLAFLGLRTPDA